MRKQRLCYLESQPKRSYWKNDSSIRPSLIGQKWQLLYSSNIASWAAVQQWFRLPQTQSEESQEDDHLKDQKV
jgi:hypothetical protein